MKDDEQTQSDEEYFNELDQLEASAGSVLAVSDKLAQQLKDARSNSGIEEVLGRSQSPMNSTEDCIAELIKASGFEGEVTSILYYELDSKEITGIFLSGVKNLGYRISGEKATVFDLDVG